LAQIQTKKQNKMNIFFSLVVVIVLFDSTSVHVVLANDTVDHSSSMSMTPIDPNKNNMDSIQDIDEIWIDTGVWSCSGSVPNTMFTIFPSDNDKDGSSGGGGVTVETSPANLFTVTNDLYYEGSLSFEWNQNVSSIATYGGVRIGVPSDQLLYVSVGDGHNVQILDGFTNITSLNVNDDGSILQLMTTSLSTGFSLSSNSGGYMYLKTNIPVDGSLITSGGRSYVETPSYNKIQVQSVDSELNIKGDINVSTTNFSTVSEGAQLTVTGTITGTIYTSENSTVNAPSCDNVISDGDNSTCNAGPQTVDVDVDLSQNSIRTLNGTRSCDDDGYDDLYLSDSSSSSSFTHVCLSDIIIAVAAVAVASTSMLI